MIFPEYFFSLFQVVDSGKNFVVPPSAPSSSSSPFSPFFSSSSSSGGAPWHEGLARYWQIGEDLGWDPECVFGEICADLAPKSGGQEQPGGVVDGVIKRASVKHILYLLVAVTVQFRRYSEMGWSATKSLLIPKPKSSSLQY